jgi:hypothetical protein
MGHLRDWPNGTHSPCQNNWKVRNNQEHDRTIWIQRRLFLRSDSIRNWRSPRFHVQFPRGCGRIHCEFDPRSVQAGVPQSSWLEGVRLPGKLEHGGVGERLNPAVLKTVRPERVSGVRIPPPPYSSRYISLCVLCCP